MKTGYSLEFHQTQKLVMTPELRQAIAILQMNTQELACLIRQQVEENPLLEIQEELPDDVTGEPERDELDEWAEYIGLSTDYAGPVGEERNKNPVYETAASEDITLRDLLMMQLGVSGLSQQERSVGEYIVGNIDNHGYLRADLEEIARASGAPLETVRRVLQVVQSFDPPGVGARDLRECLLLQLDALGIDDRVVRSVVERHLEDLAAGRRHRIAKELGVSLEDVDRARETIAGLDPKPGARIAAGHVTYIRPDITVRKVGNEFVVILNDNDLPRIFWNPVYRKLLRSRDCPETRLFLRKKFREAWNLLRNIEQRRRTVLRVMETIVNYQKDFFEKGFGHVRPMTLRDIAEALGVHQSTVSRAVSRKYVDTPFGIVPARAFFANEVGDGVSSDSIRRMIRSMVKEEDPARPLSDMEIARMLSERGVRISRRTVAKYRDLLGIPSSSQRKKRP